MSDLQEDPYGLLAAFETPEQLLSATRKVREEGYRKMGAYTPYPVEGLAEALEFRPKVLPWVVFIGGVVGCLGGFALQYWVSTTAYPLNVGGRPLNSWPSFIPVTFETTILLASLAAVLGMLGLNGLPAPYHPLFHVDAFRRASQDAFFLCIQARDPKFDPRQTRADLQRLNPIGVWDVPK